MPNFAKIASPLHSLTRKNIYFVWSEACEAAFCELKSALVSAPVLDYPQFEDGRGFVLETDASLVGLGAILSQNRDDGEIHPITYASRSLDIHEKNYGISELETLGLVWAVRYFCPWKSLYCVHRSLCLSVHFEFSSPFWKACTLGVNHTRDGLDNKAQTW